VCAFRLSFPHNLLYVCVALFLVFVLCRQILLWNILFFIYFLPGCMVVCNWVLSVRDFDVVKSDISKKAINSASCFSQT
jgi:hypothetical protein